MFLDIYSKKGQKRFWCIQSHIFSSVFSTIHSGLVTGFAAIQVALHLHRTDRGGSAHTYRRGYRVSGRVSGYRGCFFASLKHEK